jgi:hypothetical protein
VPVMEMDKQEMEWQPGECRRTPGDQCKELAEEGGSETITILTSTIDSTEPRWNFGNDWTPAVDKNRHSPVQAQVQLHQTERLFREGKVFQDGCVVVVLEHCVIASWCTRDESKKSTQAHNLDEVLQ